MRAPLPHRVFALRPTGISWRCLPVVAAALLCCAPPSRADEPLPDLSVTGTALRRIDRDTALPITVITRTEIDRSGARTLADFLQQLPAMQGFIPPASVNGNVTGGYTSLALHNLPDSYTLVLVNGQRVAPFGGQTPLGAFSSVDANTLPLAMVERIEVLTEGATALYGADALAGVINIITRRDGEVSEGTAGWQQAVGGARTWSLSAFHGQGDVQADGQALAIGVSALRRSALPATSRAYANQSRRDFMLDGQRVRFDDSSPYSHPGNVYDSGSGSYVLRNPTLAATGTCPEGHYTTGEACQYNYVRDVMLVPAQAQHSMMASYTRRVANTTRWMIDTLWSRSTVWSQLAPMPAFMAVPNSAPADATLAAMGVADDPAYVLDRLSDLGARTRRDTSDLLHLAARTEGQLGGWRWQAGLVQARSSLRADVGGGITGQGLDAAQAAGYNPLVSNDPLSTRALQAQAYRGRWLDGTTTLQGLQWQASTEAATLPAGPLRWAVGADWRQERWQHRPSAYAQGLLSDVTTQQLGPYAANQLPLDAADAMVPTQASRQVWGAFSEWLAPLQRTDTQRWDLGASLRHDRDNRAGQATTARLNTRWQLSPTVMTRASLGTGFRTPSLGQMTSPSQGLGSTSATACTAALQAVATQLGATPCDPASGDVSFDVIGRGNRQLRPERSQQLNIGLRIEPLVGHSIGLDWWTVRVTDRIGSTNDTVAFADPLGHPQAYTTVPDGQGGSTLVRLLQPRNLGSNIISGLDLDASVRRGSSWGVVDSQLRVSTLLRDTARDSAGQPWFDAIGDGRDGAPSIRWRAHWRNSISRAGWTHSLTARYQSGYLDTPITLQVLDAQGQPTGSDVSWRQHVAGTLRWDWQTQWQATPQLQLTAGIVNVFNRKPPAALATTGALKAYIVGYDERFYDALGRMWSLQARLSF